VARRRSSWWVGRGVPGPDVGDRVGWRLGYMLAQQLVAAGETVVREWNMQMYEWSPVWSNRIVNPVWIRGRADRPVVNR
jgi:hypothetical protein